MAQNILVLGEKNKGLIIPWCPNEDREKVLGVFSDKRNIYILAQRADSATVYKYGYKTAYEDISLMGAGLYGAVAIFWALLASRAPHTYPDGYIFNFCLSAAAANAIFATIYTGLSRKKEYVLLDETTFSNVGEARKFLEGKGARENPFAVLEDQGF